MSEHITDEELTEWDKRIDGSTPSPWVWIDADEKDGRIIGFFTPIDAIWVWQGEDPPIEMSTEDAAFIALAREDLPRFIAALRESRAEVNRLQRIVDGWGKLEFSSRWAGPA